MGQALTLAIARIRAAAQTDQQYMAQLSAQVDTAIAELHAHPTEEAEEHVDNAYLEAEDRRIRRQPRGRHGQQPRCGSCRLFVSNTGVACPHCGFNDLGGFPG